jgi:hypothetical protein
VPPCPRAPSLSSSSGISPCSAITICVRFRAGEVSNSLLVRAVGKGRPGSIKPGSSWGGGARRGGRRRRRRRRGARPPSCRSRRPASGRRGCGSCRRSGRAAGPASPAWSTIEQCQQDVHGSEHPAGKHRRSAGRGQV